MKLTIGNLHTLAEVDATERDWLNGYLTVDGGKRFIDGNWKDAPPIRLYEPLGSSFPAGLTTLVMRAAEGEGFITVLADGRGFGPQPDPQVDLSWLRDYQREATMTAIIKTRGIIQHPTGAGKGHLLVALPVAVPCEWLMVVHRLDLVDQAIERYERLTGERVGRIGGGSWSEGRLTCATFASLSRALKKREPRVLNLLGRVGGLMVDEAHTAAALSHYRVLMSCNAYYRIGFSATALARTDQRNILTVAALGPVIHKLRPDDLIEQGILAKPRIVMTPVEHTSDKATWQGIYGECIVRSNARNRAVVEAVKQAPKPCLLFVKEIRHGKNLYKLLSKAGLRADFVWGNSGSALRHGSVKMLERGQLDVLVCSVVFQEGIDIPSLASVVIASGGRSAIAALQRVGRGMRSNDGQKTEFEVHDFADRGHNWLERHTRERLKAYRDQGYEIHAGSK